MDVESWLYDVMNINEYSGSFIDFMTVDCRIYSANKLCEMIILILITYRFYTNISPTCMSTEKSDTHIELKILKGKIRT